MKPLVTNQRMLTWLLLCPDEETNSIRKKLASTGFSVANFIFIIICVASSVAYLVKFVSIDLEQSLFAVLQIVSSSPVLYVLVVAFLSRHKIQTLCEHLSEIYQEYENEESFKYLARASTQSEWMCKFYSKYVLGGFFSMLVMMPAISILICWLIHDELDVKYLFLPGKMIFPWDQTTLLGYFAEVGYVLIGGEFITFSNGTILLLFISMCLHHRAFYRMYQHSVHKLDRPDKDRNDKELICKLINFQITVKEWFSDSATLYSPILLVYLISNMMTTACAIFQLDLLLKNIHFEITIVLFAVAYGISNLLLYCYLGKLATESYAKMADSLYECNWYELPLELQKYFILMIANAQRPVYYHGFNVAVLNLETFCKLVRAIYTYYMIFKTLTTE